MHKNYLLTEGTLKTVVYVDRKTSKLQKEQGWRRLTRIRNEELISSTFESTEFVRMNFDRPTRSNPLHQLLIFTVWIN